MNPTVTYAASRYARLVGLEDREEVLREVRTRLLQLALDAHAKEEISKGRLVELCDKLGMSPKEKTELLEKPTPAARLDALP